jgi:hypothetical protein
LLKHGVWPHIAEQVSRFVVALQNGDTLRTIRDRLFEHVLATDVAAEVAQLFGVGVERLLQQIELFVESVQPNVAIFIDETNQDLNDFAHALDIPTKIFRIKKLIVNGSPEYYSPDEAIPVITTSPEDKIIPGTHDFDVVEQLGGGTVVAGEGRTKCYDLGDGRVVHVKRSKFHEKNNYYWYGINHNSLEHVQNLGATHFVFVLGEWGFATVPIETVVEYCHHAKVSKNLDGTVRHYHVLISPEPEPELYWSQDTSRHDLTSFCQTFG